VSFRRNLSAGAYNLLVTTLGQLALTPLLLSFWGTERYAHWLVLYAIPAYLGLSEAGISSSFGNKLAIALEQGRRSHAVTMAKAVRRWQAWVWLVVFVVFISTLLFLPLQRWLGLERVPVVVFRGAAACLAIYSLGNIQTGYYMSLFRAAGQYAQFTFAFGNLRIAEIVLLAANASLGGGVLEASILLVVNRALFLLWCLRREETLLPGITARGPAPLGAFLEMLPTGLAFLAFPLGNALINQGATVLLNRLGTESDVVKLSVGRQMARLFLNLVNLVSQAAHPDMSVAYARGDHARMKSIQVGLLRLVIWLSPVVILAAAVMGPKVVELWSGRVVYLTAGFAALLALESCMAAAGNLGILSAWATNRHVSLCWVFLATQISALLLAGFLLPAGGVDSFPLAFAAVSLFNVCATVVVSGRVIQCGGVALISESVDFGGTWVAAKHVWHRTIIRLSSR
jgi:O-antigen/teichoic acid export membrane protein